MFSDTGPVFRGKKPHHCKQGGERGSFGFRLFCGVQVEHVAQVVQKVRGWPSWWSFAMKGLLGFRV